MFDGLISVFPRQLKRKKKKKKLGSPDQYVQLPLLHVRMQALAKHYSKSTAKASRSIDATNSSIETLE